MYDLHMNSINDRSVENETIIYRTHCHWAILLGPILVVVIGGLALGSRGYHAMILMAFGVLWGICANINLRRSQIILTKSRLIIDVGFPLKRSYDVPLNEISGVDFYQPSLGSMLNFGKLILVFKEKKKLAVRFISSPAEFVKEVQQQIMALRSSSAAEQ